MIEIPARRLLAAALAVAVLAVAGCGSSSNPSSVSAASYVKSVCTAATTWKNAIQSAGSQLQSQASSKSLPKTKSAYVSFVSSLVSATGAAQSQLSSAGAPSVSNGKRISSTLVGIFTNAKHSLTQALSDAQAIPTGNAKDFQTKAAAVQGDVRSALAAMSSVTPEKNPALHAAAANDPTCKTLASGA
jgi:ABC-type Fe3+-citrate transport system substrate-binding protein